jgi:hypothetical protein
MGCNQSSTGDNLYCLKQGWSGAVAKAHLMSLQLVLVGACACTLLR